MEKQELLKCIGDAEQIPFEYDNSILSGLSGKKIISLLRNLAGKILNDRVTYLEVGVYQGLSLLSVADSAPQVEIFGIDNFASFDKEGKNLNIVNERIRSMNADNAKIINKDYEDALENLADFIGSKKVGLFFVDGPHDYRSQLMCLMLIKPHLASNAVIVVDDSNYRHVRQANRDFLLTNPDFRLIYQTYTKAHPANLSGDDKKGAETGWWNGINVIVKDNDNLFEPFFPPTMRSRQLFENDHHIHTIRYPEAVRKYAGLINLLAGIRSNQFRKDLTGEYNMLNTFSSGLDEVKFNPSFSGQSRADS
jgi:predicted O-methyltransferase YrrM